MSCYTLYLNRFRALPAYVRCRLVENYGTLGRLNGVLSKQQLGMPLPGNAEVADYLPYDALLPYTDVFVSNSGTTGLYTG